RRLAAPPALSTPPPLGLEGTCLATRLIRALLGALPDAALSSLDLTSNNCGVEGARALAGSPALGGLRVLRLGGNQIGLEGAEALAASPAVAGLAVLGLTRNDLGPRAAEGPANSGHLGGARDLGLREHRTLDTGPAALARSPVLRLSGLGLAHADPGPEGMRALARSPGMAGLAFLDLFDDNEVGDAGLRVLAGSAHMSGLRGLGLYAVRGSAAGVRALASSPHPGHPGALALSHTRLDEAAARGPGGPAPP